MKSYFKCDISYSKIIDGDPKDVKESYLVAAVNFTDAETTIIDQITKLVTKEFIVLNIAKFKLTDLIDPDFGADYFLAKSSFLSVSEQGKEKKVTERALINANSLQKAMDKLTEFHKNTAPSLHIRIESIAECPIVEVFDNQAEQATMNNLTRKLRKDLEGVEITIR